VFSETDSTNTRACEAASGLASESLPALFLAEHQTAGRGRGTNRWWSAEGSLTFSLLLQPLRLGLEVSRWPALSLTVGAAAAEAIAHFLPAADVRLKWPNDVYVDGRKVCGILNESPPAAPGLLVVGIGINVNTPLEQAPPEVADRLTSLRAARGEFVDREAALIATLHQLERDLQSLSAGDAGLFERWRTLCLLTGRTVVVTQLDRDIAGTCLGIDDDGALRIETGAGVQRVFSGVVSEFG
jgi:BirA family biotin operon repressor/biotin-[acetyl-CoA-carboxylase] ligase